MARSPVRARRARWERRRSPATCRPLAPTASPVTPARPQPSPAGQAEIHVHAATDTNCSNCHNGTTATGMKTPPHIPVTGVQCSPCHDNTTPSFATYTMGQPGHGTVSASRCDSCHNGSFTGEGTTGAFGTASFPNHVATNGKDCVTLSRERGRGLRELGGRQVYPRGERHQLFELSQRHHRDRHEDAAAHSGDGSSMQPLPRQYEAELCDLYDGADRSRDGQRQPLRLLSQRVIHR